MKKIIGTILSSIYQAVVVLVQVGYRKLPWRIKKVKARVISVGNITWGGTGKTPLVAKLARDLAFYGKKVAVLTRGYGKDEVEELKRKLPDIPILVGRDRVRNAKRAVEKYGADILILDDGFQHLRLHRDLDVVNINATLPFGPGGLIPAGTLREPLENLSRAHIFILSKSNIGSKNLHWIRQKLHSIKPDTAIFEAVHKPMRFVEMVRNRTVTLGEARGKKVAVISGIGDPYSFEKTIEKIGVEILFAARFDDHHAYTEKDLSDFLVHCQEAEVQDVITTGKDSIRLEPFLKRGIPAGIQQYQWLVLEIEFQVHDEEDFIRRCLNSQTH